MERMKVFSPRRVGYFSVWVPPIILGTFLGFRYVQSVSPLLLTLVVAGMLTLMFIQHEVHVLSGRSSSSYGASKLHLIPLGVSCFILTLALTLFRPFTPIFVLAAVAVFLMNTYGDFRGECWGLGTAVAGMAVFYVVTETLTVGAGLICLGMGLTSYFIARVYRYMSGDYDKIHVSVRMRLLPLLIFYYVFAFLLVGLGLLFL